MASRGSQPLSLQPYSEDPPSPQKATRKDFQNEPMPDTKEELLLERHFDADQYERMKQGVIPQEMEDRWFIYFDARSREFRFHRSWTGFCIFIVKVKDDANGGCHIVKSWVNRDPVQHDGSEDLKKVAILALWLIDVLLLKQERPFPDR
jgi:hypothetical protein